MCCHIDLVNVPIVDLAYVLLRPNVLYDLLTLKQGILDTNLLIKILLENVVAKILFVIDELLKLRLEFFGIRKHLSQVYRHLL